MNERRPSGQEVRVASPWRAAILAAAMALGALAGCGGGGGGDSAASGSTASQGGGTVDKTFGRAVALRIEPDLGHLLAAGSTASVTVIAVNDKGEVRDVTAQASLVADAPGRVAARVVGGKLELAFTATTGPTTLRFGAAGITLDRPTWVTRYLPVERAYTRFHVNVAEVFFSSVTPAADKSYPVLPGRTLVIDATAVYDGGVQDVLNEITMTSSDPGVLSLRRALDSNGNVSRWIATTWAPGMATVTIRWGALESRVVVDIHDALMVQAPLAGQVGLTEDATGRLTAYLLAGSDLADRRVTLFESAGGNRWAQGPTLPLPNGVFSIVGGVRAAEAPNGFRAVVTTNTLGTAWVQLISPDGAVRGPVLLPGALVDVVSLHLAVSPDGDAHLWVRSANSLARLRVRSSDLGVVTVNTLALPADMVGLPGVAVSGSGTVGVAWLDGTCGVNLAFDDLANRGPVPPAARRRITVDACAPTWFANISTGFRIAAGRDELGLVLQQGTDFNATRTSVILAARNGATAVTSLDSDTGVTSGWPDIAMTDAGEAVVLWQTVLRGVWAAHRAAGATPGRPFLVEPPEDTLATPGLQGAYSRGDGRFVLSWKAGRPGVRNEIGLREYSAAGGLGGYQSLPFQNSTATNLTSLLASPYGVSALWSFPTDSGYDEVDAVQHFLP